MNENINPKINEILAEKGVRTLVAAQAGAAVYLMDGGKGEGDTWAMRLITTMVLLDDCMRSSPEDRARKASLIGAAGACLSMVSLATEVSLQACFEKITADPIAVFKSCVTDLDAHPYMQAYFEDDAEG